MNKNGYPHWILLITLCLLIAVSFIPQINFGGWKSKSFNMFADVLTDSLLVNNDNVEMASGDNAAVNDTVIQQLNEGEGKSSTVGVNVKDIKLDSANVSIAPMANGEVMIEDYTGNNTGMRNFITALNRRNTLGRPVRIAVLGDSYIEGDIFTQDVRDALQQQYGGKGVGYVNMYTDIPGFRNTLRQSGKGWKKYESAKGKPNYSYMSISECYYEPSASEATAVYKGVSKFHNLDKWDTSKLLYFAANDGVIEYKTNGEWQRYTVKGSSELQCLTVNGNTSEFSVRTSSKISALGVWLDGNTGVQVDCMSSRGYSGSTLLMISQELAQKMSRHIPYDMIILEFGTNVIYAGQLNYDIYARKLVAIVNRLRESYPQADIMILGVGDRGKKRGANIASMPEAAAMLSAQRSAAHTARCLFWDTRQAMGGEGSSIRWAQHEPPLINKDYIHLSHAGGKALSDHFVKSLNMYINSHK